MNRSPVFNQNDWHPTADSLWEATASPPDLDSPPPFEATCRATHDSDQGWCWALYQPASDHPAAVLILVANGSASTLAEAQRHANNNAQQWRDQSTAMAATCRLENYTDHSIVTCDICGAAHRLGELLSYATSCNVELTDHDRCNSTGFDGFNIDVIAQAATQMTNHGTTPTKRTQNSAEGSYPNVDIGRACLLVHP